VHPGFVIRFCCKPHLSKQKYLNWACATAGGTKFNASARLRMSFGFMVFILAAASYANGHS
jgi:hypothetical protein